MNLHKRELHIATLSILTFTAVFMITYAVMIGNFVNTEMHYYDEPPMTAQELFDAQSPFSEKRQDGSQGEPSAAFGPNNPPSSQGPSYPPPRN